ncbi:MAG: ketopantoate reductase family protein [Candidatus Omnitrophica bacterium]|nr:ketopantoate reductase family protein [Candidatus Omnitrophota bacterium]
MSAQKFIKKKAKTGEKKLKPKPIQAKVEARPEKKEEAIPIPAAKLKICIIGPGAIGGLIAAYLKAKMRKITAVGKTEQMRIIRSNGLKIEGARGTVYVELDIRVKMKEKADLVILAVKTQDIAGVIAENRAFLEDALILTIQNGVRADQIISLTLGKENIISSIIMFGSTYLKSGLITHNFEGDWIIGRPFGTNDDKVKEVVEELSPAFKVVLVDNITSMKWTKLFINANNCVPALLDKSIQETFADLDMAKLSILLLKECFAVVDDAGIQLVDLPNFEVNKFRGLTQMPLEEAAKIFSGIMINLSKEPLYGSILQSIKRDRASEIDYINGEIIKLSRFGRVGAELNTKVVNLIHQVEKTKKFFTVEEIKDKFKLRDVK